MIITQKMLIETIKTLEANKNKFPEGSLKIKTSGRLQFYLLKNKMESYIPKTNEDLIRKLCQKKYEAKMLKVAKENLARLNSNKPFLEMDKPYSKLNKIRKEYVKPLFISDEDYKKQWQQQKFERYNLSFDNGFFTTNRGEMVRSKSEILIANTLDRLNVAYFYEKPIKVEGDIYSPDFTILNTKTREEIIWEHFGRMNDEAYRFKTWNKIHSYLREGYVLGQNFIATFEEASYPLQVKDLELLIKKYLD